LELGCNGCFAGQQLLDGRPAPLAESRQPPLGAQPAPCFRHQLFMLRALRH
jgi:hypothetical protein